MLSARCLLQHWVAELSAELRHVGGYNRFLIPVLRAAQTYIVYQLNYLDVVFQSSSSRDRPCSGRLLRQRRGPRDVPFSIAAPSRPSERLPSILGCLVREPVEPAILQQLLVH